MKKFVIFTTQRSGSRFLVDYLSSHPNIECHDEIFIHRAFDKDPKHDRYYEYCSKHLVRTILTRLQFDQLIIPYFLKEFFRKVNRNEEAPKRCVLCWQLRLEETARFGKENKFDFFTTTLLVSPYQNHPALKETGESC